MCYLLIEEKMRTPLKIKSNEILFVRMHHRTEEQRICCTSEYYYTIVDHKHLKNLIRKDTKSSTATKSTSTSPEVTKRTAHDTNREPSSCCLGIYHILRISKCRWRIALLVCSFETEALREKWEQFLRSLSQCKVDFFLLTLDDFTHSLCFSIFSF